MNRAMALWNAYWFRPASLFNLCVCRLWLVGFFLFILFFPHAVLTVPPYTRFEEMAALPQEHWNPLLIFRLLTLPFGTDYRPTAEHLHIALLIAKISGALALIGLRTRTSLGVFVLSLVFILAHSHSYLEYHHIETIPIMMLTLLACSPSGARLSVDAWIAHRKQSPPPLLEHRDILAGWPLRLMAWMFSLIYLSATFCKLGGSGLDWLNGYTMQHYLLQDALYWGNDLGQWAGKSFFIGWLMGWLTIIFEGTFFLVLIFPRIAWIYAVIGIGFHLGIYFTLSAPFILYMVAYSSILPWDRWVCRARGLERPPIVVP